MTTIHELRTVLHERAGLLDHGAEAMRRSAVARRVHAARRRRRTAAVAAAAVIVGSAGAGAVLLRRPDVAPATRLLGGVEAPVRITSLGYGFDFDRGIESDPGDRRLPLHLAASEDARVVSWTAGPGARLTGHEGEVQRPALALPSEFGGFELVEPGQEATFVLTDPTAAPMAFAIYDLAKDAPGYTAEGITFRDQTPAGSLLGAAVERGSSEVSVSVTMPAGGLQLTSVCGTSAPATDPRGVGPWLSISIDGSGGLGTSCDGPRPVPFDPGGKGGFGIGGQIGGRTIPAGTRVEVTMRLVRGPRDSTPVDDVDALLGLGVYATVDNAFELAPGLPGDRVIERGGQVYIAESTTVADPGARRLDLDLDPGSADELVVEGYYTSDARQQRFSWVVDGDVVSSVRNQTGPTTSGIGLGSLWPGQARHLSLRWDSTPSPTDRMAIVTYRRAQ